MRNTPFNQLTYTVIDTETTGYSPKYAKMVEIAAVKIYPDYQIDYNDTFSALINPEIDIPYNAYKIHKRNPQKIYGLNFFEKPEQDDNRQPEKSLQLKSKGDSVKDHSHSALILHKK